MTTNSFRSTRRRVYGPRCASPPTFVCYELPQYDSYSHYDTSSDEDDSVDGKSTCDSDSTSDHEKANDASYSQNSPEIMTSNAPEQLAKDGVGSQGALVGEVREDDDPSIQDTLRLREKREGKRREVETDNAQSTNQEAGQDAADLNESAPNISLVSPRRSRGSRKASNPSNMGPPLRPILTIRSSQGFLWNQDLFVPTYLKERYLTTSGSAVGIPNNFAFAGQNFFSSSGGVEHEVECVEIRISEGELDGLLPRAQ